MLINRRNALFGGKQPLFSLYKQGTVSQGFYKTGIGTLSLPKTCVCWYKFSAFNFDVDVYQTPSRCVFKLGDGSSGIGFGAAMHTPGNKFSSHDCLVEAKYWSYMNNSSLASRYDTDWHHLAIIFKSGSYPLSNSVYIDGNVCASSNGSASMNTPRGAFSIGGRASSDTLDASVLVHRFYIYDGAMLPDDIAADIALGAKPPTSGNVIHYWDGTLDNNLVRDLVGDWHLSLSDGCTIVSESPWNASAANGGGGYKRQCVRRSYRRSLRPSARFWQPRLWKEVA